MLDFIFIVMAFFFGYSAGRDGADLQELYPKYVENAYCKWDVTEEEGKQVKFQRCFRIVEVAPEK